MVGAILQGAGWGRDQRGSEQIVSSQQLGSFCKNLNAQANENSGTICTSLGEKPGFVS